MDTPCCASSISGFCTLHTASTISISSVGSVRTASTRSADILSTCTVYVKYDVYFGRLCTVSTIFRPIVRHSQMVLRVGVGAKYFRWGQLEYLEHWHYFRNIYCEEYALRALSVSRGSVLPILPVLQVFRTSILRVHTCLCLRGSVLLIL